MYIKYRLSASGKFGNAECENKADIPDIDNRTPIIGHHYNYCVSIGSIVHGLFSLNYILEAGYILAGHCCFPSIIYWADERGGSLGVSVGCVVFCVLQLIQ